MTKTCEVCKGNENVVLTKVRDKHKILLGEVCICEGCKKNVFNNKTKEIKDYMMQVLTDRGEIKKQQTDEELKSIFDEATKETSDIAEFAKLMLEKLSA